MTKIYKQTIIFLIYKLVGMYMIPTNVMIKKREKTSSCACIMILHI
jgi:hypothetical protein